jgi:hypothetical protein
VVNLLKLNRSAREYATALIKRFPRLRRNLTVKEHGDFETFIWSPPTSNAGAIICQSFRGDVWVRFAPGQTGCCCESVPDLLNTVRDLMAGKLVIAVVSRKNIWVETILSPVGANPALKRGQAVAIYSWTAPRKRRPKAMLRKPSTVGGAA